MYMCIYSYFMHDKEKYDSRTSLLLLWQAMSPHTAK